MQIKLVVVEVVVAVVVIVVWRYGSKSPLTWQNIRESVLVGRIRGVLHLLIRFVFVQVLNNNEKQHIHRLSSSGGYFLVCMLRLLSKATPKSGGKYSQTSINWSPSGNGQLTA